MALSTVRHASFAAILLAAACGGDGKKIDTPPPSTAEPVATSEPVTEGGEGGGGGDGAPAASASAVTPPPDKPVSSGRPAIQMGPSKTIKSTFGATPGSILKLKGDAGTYTLSIPEFALGAGTNIEWSVGGSSAEKKHAVIGNIIYLHSQLGTQKEPSVIKTRGSNFELRWPLLGKDTFNLAIGEIAIGDEGALGKVKSWVVIAPKRVEKGLDEIYFEIDALKPAWLHATTAAPTEAAAAPPP